MGKVVDARWGTIGIELFIVFVGLFAALQVDDWRDQRVSYDTETRYLQRLSEDFQAFLSESETRLPFLERNYDAVRHVSESLAAGHIIDDNVGMFETGLIYVGTLPSTTMHRSAYDEMVAAGMFAGLRSEDLKRAVSNLYATQIMVERNFLWWRNAPIRIETMLMARVDFFSEGVPDPESAILLNEPRRRVTFDCVFYTQIIK